MHEFKTHQKNEGDKMWNSPVIAGRNGSPEAAVFLFGKGTASISGVTQFKELQSKKNPQLWAFV